MPEPKTTVAKTNRRLMTDPRSQTPLHQKQQRTMVVALTLLLIALGFVLYHDRDFWFPDTQEAQESEDQPQPEMQPAAPPAASPTQTTAAKPILSHTNKSGRAKSQPASSPAPAAPVSDPSAPMTATTTRTILPALEVEVVAGDIHRTLHPSSNSVHVDLQPSAPEEPASRTPATTSDTAARVTTDAAERVQIFSGSAEIVSRPVRPDYPRLARQMKVQGSVILQALIGRDGLIQDLRVLSGPPILATAAQEAVRQWHFKPHYLGADPVETQAKITVNFTISTN